MAFGDSNHVEVAFEAIQLSEHHLPVMSTLDDVVRVVRELGSAYARHGDPLSICVFPVDGLFIGGWENKSVPFFALTMRLRNETTFLQRF